MPIRNADALGRTTVRQTALACLEAGIEAALPEQVVAERVRYADETLTVAGETYDLAGVERVVLVGGGKGSGRVAAALAETLGDRLDTGVVVDAEPTDAGPVSVVVGDHPTPSERGVAGAQQVLDLVKTADESTLVLAVVTGGASALLPAPADGIALDDLQTVTRRLLDAGASVGELNAVRKHVSALKGGQLARAAAPASVVTLAFSDVVGDPPDVIGSGPTVPDESTFEEALAVLDRYDVDVPSVRDRLDRGVAGEVAETPKPGDSVFDGTSYHVLANAHTALDAAAEAAREHEFDPTILSSRIEGEAREAGRFHAAVAREVGETGNPVEAPAVLLSGGECTVTVRGDGTGGPNQEFALAAALDLQAVSEVAVGAVDTDGRDGSTDAAGALVDGETVREEPAAREALAANDAFGYLSGRDDLVRTGATGTNVNDLRVVVVA
ncbi:glycerate kinase type-2 family protein [Haloarchaeobius amylolyticus]|uniref:glycerate kinase type-2 family protein n=1 Tax=Haloarchaeobius amylolyticus TaxID=1198296 RepID=UPI00226E71D5|nr:DUF4147 domain-containing protein [Haloarchaeobius amylolyticus]